MCPAATLAKRVRIVQVAPLERPIATALCSYLFRFQNIDIIHLNPVRLCIRAGSDSSDRNPLLSTLSAASRLAKTVLPMQSSRSASRYARLD